MNKKRWLTLSVLLTFILIFVLALNNRDDINDWLTLRSYSPPANITKLATDSGMSDTGKKLFYVGTPEITTGENFNSKCREREETKVLGCIVASQTAGLSLFNGNSYEIYILDVKEPSLKGIQEVTSAHEMLHAAYDRLSNAERQKLDAEIQRVYQNTSNENLRNTVEAYAEQDSSIVNNELHSLLGTEIANLSPELEEHYAKYFSDRSKVVKLYQEYEKVFDEARNASQQLLGKINLMDNQINTLQQQLQDESNALERDKNIIDSMQNSGNFDNLQSMILAYNRRVDQFNNKLASTKKLINERNDLAKSYDELVVKEQQLINAIDSNSIPEAKL
jgi:hypothetical protein